MKELLMKKKIISLLLIILLLVSWGSSFAGNVYIACAGENVTVIASGNCGDPSWTLYSDGTLDIEGEGEVWCDGQWKEKYMTSIKKITVGEGITSIAGFEELYMLKEVELPDTLEKIVNYTFYDCKSLEEVHIPDSVYFIGKWVFDKCSSLKKANIPTGLKIVPDSCFDLCKRLESIVIPEGIMIVGESSFSGCTGLKKIYFEGTCPTFYDYSFNGVSAELFYPAEDTSWRTADLSNCGGNFVLKPYIIVDGVPQEVTPEPTVVPTPVPTLEPFDIEGMTVSERAPAAHRVSTPINPDGFVEEVWNGLPNYAIRDTKGEIAAVVNLAWDEDNLYVLERVKDTELDSSSPNTWERDGGDVYLDEDNSKEDNYYENEDAFQYRLSGFNEEKTTCCYFSSASDYASEMYSDIRSSARILNGGYIMEHMIPWNKKNTVAVGNIIGFDISIFDCSAGKRQNEWKLLTEYKDLWSNPGHFGEVKLVDSAVEPSNAPTATATPLPTLQPGYEEYIVDLADNSSCKMEQGVAKTIGYNETNKTLDIKMGEFMGVVFVLPDIAVNKGNKIEMTYRLSYGDLRSYVYDGAFNGRYGQNDPGAHELGIDETTEFKTVTYEVGENYKDDCIKAIKLFNWSGKGDAILHIRSLRYLYVYDGHTPAPTATPHVTAVPSGSPIVTPTTMPTATSVPSMTPEQTEAPVSVQEPTEVPSWELQSASISESGTTVTPEISVLLNPTATDVPSPAPKQTAVPKQTASSKTASIIKPTFKLKKGRTLKGRKCIIITLKRYQGTDIEIYNCNGKKRVKIKLAGTSIKKNKNQFKLTYNKDNYVYKICVRTYKRVKGKIVKSPYSVVKRIRG